MKDKPMRNLVLSGLLTVMFSGLFPIQETITAQAFKEVSVLPGETHQALVGFGGSLAYYENWLTAHPNKDGIYDALFGELSLDILRVRNAYDYDPGMVIRVLSLKGGAEKVRKKPIAIMSTSWGPPGYLKSNNDRTHGGTLKYTAGPGGVEFDYAGFAEWWDGALDEYAYWGIYPAYISIQNEPDWTADYESCRFNPSETVTASDTLAGYNKALDAVYDTIMKRDRKPHFLGPECIGIGYNAVENYINPLDLSKLYGIAHHLYHGANENDPFSSSNYTKVGDFHPEVPHFQTEYSRGDWFPLGGMIYKTLNDENAVAFLYWDLIWNDGGLIDVDFPWDKTQWSNPNGYARTKDFYVFKQFSAFIQPGWLRTSLSASGNSWKALAFASPDMDSAAFVLINQSTTDSLGIQLGIAGYSIDRSDIYTTSGSSNCRNAGHLQDSRLRVPPYSITTVAMKISELPPQIDCNGDTNGVAFIDSCGICAGGNTGVDPVLDPDVCYPVDCNGDTNGTAFPDSCGTCAGGNTGITPVLLPGECADGVSEQLLPGSGPILHFDPVLDRLSLKIPAETGRVQLLDLSGKFLMERKINASESTVNVAGLKGGLYLVRIFYANRVYTGKFLKY
jgi:glucuronoarabinoxylan endo-1,4-beta-xylanase